MTTATITSSNVGINKEAAVADSNNNLEAVQDASKENPAIKKKFKYHTKSTLKLEGSPAYDNMFYAINSPETMRNYRHGLMRFMEFLGVQDIDDLLQNADKPVLIETKIMSFLRALRDNPKYNKITYSTRQAYLYAILAFYKHNDVTLRTERIASNLGGGLRRQHNDRGYTREEIKRMLEHTDVRTRALILFLASTGCRIGAIPDLKLKHLKKIEEYGLYQVLVYENTNDQYVCFTTRESAEAIDSYLSYRQQHGEQLTPNSPLLRNRFNIEQVAPEKVGRHIQALKRKGVSELVHTVLERSGLLREQQVKREEALSEKNGLQQYQQQQVVPHHHQGAVRHETKMNHAFRKWYNLTLIQANVRQVTKEMLIGHKASLKLDLNYYRPSDNELLQEFLKAADLLTFSDEHRLKQKVRVLEEKQSDLEMLKLAQKQQETERYQVEAAYESRIYQLEEEKKAQEDQIQQINQTLQSMLSQLKDEIRPKLKKMEQDVNKY